MKQLHCPAQERKHKEWEEGPEGLAFKERMKKFWEDYNKK